MAAFKSPGEKTEVPKGVLTPLRAEAPKGVLTPLRNEAKINGTPQGQKARERKNYGNSVNDNSNYYIHYKNLYYLVVIHLIQRFT